MSFYKREVKKKILYNNSQLLQITSIVKLTQKPLIFLLIIISIFFINCKYTIKSEYKSIDLTKLKWNAKTGFDLKDKNGFNTKNSNSIQIKKFPILLNKIFKIPISSKINEFTVQTKVFIPSKVIKKMESPAIFLRGIGESWAVYFNGHLIENKISKSKNHIKRNYIVPIKKKYLEKENTVVFRIKGYAPATILNKNILLGLTFNKGYLIQEERVLFYKITQIIRWLLIGIYFFFGLYHLFFFIRYKEILYNLFFGLFSIFLSVYFFSFANYSFLIINNSNMQFLLAYIVQPLALQAFLFFVFFYFYKKEPFTWALKTSTILNLISILLLLILPYRFYQSILMLWYIFAIFQFIYILYFIISMIRQKRNDAIQIGITILIVLVAVLWDMLDTLLFRSQVRLTGPIFYVFILLMTGILANRFVFLQKETKQLNTNLITTNNELNSAQVSILASEKKYRNLIEGFNDIIFILDDNLNFTSCNKSIKKVLQYKPDDILDKHFYKIFYEDVFNSNSISSSFVKNKINELFDKKHTVQFYSNFKLQYFKEPKELTVTLQYLEDNEKIEIFGKISEIGKNLLQQSFLAEKLSYRINNYINHAELITRKITQNLSKLLEKNKIFEITLALKEIIINAIEHGNLNISYEEKTQAQLNDTFENLLKERQKNPKYKDKKVLISSIVSSKKIAFKIQDEGKGFDHRKLEKEKNKANEKELSHGRGIIITKSVFDKVIYNDIGNQVTLVKYL